MKGLLLKDMYLLKDNKMLVGVMIIMAMMFVIINSNASFLVAFMTMIMGMLVITTISYDDFDHSNTFLMTLPITRQLYVKEKYCLGLLLAGSGWLISSVIATMIQYATIPQLNMIEWFAGLSSSIMIVILFLSIMIPVQLKFGGDKGRIVIVGCFLLIFLAAAGIMGICKLANIDIERLLINISQISTVSIVGFILAVTAVSLSISYYISSRIMVKKQF